MAETIPVAPEVLRWARHTALASETEAAEAVGRPIETISAWEAGQAAPTYGQLEKLADEYGVSTNVLLLPKAPNLKDPPPDFRAFSGRAREPIGRRTRRELRRARYLQDLVGELKVLPPVAIAQVHQGKDAAAITRMSLGVSVAQQVGWKNEHQAFREWRAALNVLGVLVMQAPLPLDELRGLSLAQVDAAPPVILVNQSDWPNARVFTLLHELGHLVLAGEGGICDPWRHVTRASRSTLESRCNRFAGAVLVPDQELAGRPETDQIRNEPHVAAKITLLTALGRRYRVSPQVIWYRIHELGLVSDTAFRELWSDLRPPVKPRRPKDDDAEGGGISRLRRAQTGYGPEVISGLIGAADRGALSQSQLTRALNVTIDDVARLQGGDTGVA